MGKLHYCKKCHFDYICEVKDCDMPNEYVCDNHLGITKNNHGKQSGD